MISIIMRPLPNLIQRFKDNAYIIHGHGVLHLMGGGQHMSAVPSTNPVGPEDVRFKLFRRPTFSLLNVNAGYKCQFTAKFFVRFFKIITGFGLKRLQAVQSRVHANLASMFSIPYAWMACVRR